MYGDLRGFDAPEINAECRWSGPVMSEHRRTPRRRILKRGIIGLRNAGTIDCIVRNISDTGAALDVASPIGIPRDFTLIVEPDIHSACYIARYKGNRIGVRFGFIAS
jgi:hypothetical protein